MRMKKEKYHLEYVFDRVSLDSLWRNLSTGVGLSEWFADEVNMEGEQVSFSWSEGDEDIAHITNLNPGESIRFEWADEPGTYLEFCVHTAELTGSRSLEITDFAERAEQIGSIELWDRQIDRLRHVLGVSNS